MQQSENRPHIDKTQKSLAMLAIMRRIEEKRKKRSRRRTPAVRAETPGITLVSDLTSDESLESAE